MAKSQGDAVTTRDIRDAVLKRFPSNQWAVVYECAWSVGSGNRGDVVAMNLWHSRGLEIHGVEIKASRGDWLRELKQPEKAEGLFMYCDRWWLAAGDRSIVKDGELPPNWGLLVYRKGGTVQAAVPAPKLKPNPIDRSFVAELLRRSAADVDTKLAHARSEEREKLEGQAESFKHRETRKELERLTKSLAEFEQASGLKIEEWNGGHLGRAIDELRRIQGYRDPTEFKAQEELRDARHFLQRYLKNIDEDLGKLEAMHRVASAAPQLTPSNGGSRG